MPTIVEKYFDPGDFAAREQQILQEVLAATGFVPERELFRGSIYDASKLGSVILRGRYHNRPAVLKLQGLNVEVDEVATLRQFTRQNRSTRIRVPEVLLSSPWEESRGYGYFVMEYVAGLSIFAMPDPSDHDLAEFARFYQEYRTNAVREPWIDRPRVSTVQFVLGRIDRWQTIRESKPDNDPGEYAERLTRFKKLAHQHYADVPMVFAHGHITANDVLVEDRAWVLLSNLYWTWRPRLYDATFAIWACLMRLDRPTDSGTQALALMDRWHTVYRENTTVIGHSVQADRTLQMGLLERCMGMLLADLALHDRFRTPEGQRQRAKLLEIAQAVFDSLAEQLA